MEATRRKDSTNQDFWNIKSLRCESVSESDPRCKIIDVSKQAGNKINCNGDADPLDRVQCIDLDSMFPQYPCAHRHVLAEGTLEKRSAWRGTWAPRYFVLEASGRLSYLDSFSDRLFPERAKRSLGINVSASFSVMQSSSRDKIVIEIKAKDAGDGRRSLALAFRELEEFDRWLTALADAQRNVRYVSVRGLSHFAGRRRASNWL